MKKKEEKMSTAHSKDVNKEIVVEVARQFADGLKGMPYEHFLSVLKGLVVGFATIIKRVKDDVVVSEEDGLEKLFLYWLASTDKASGNAFGKYIRTELIVNKNMEDEDNGGEQSAN